MHWEFTFELVRMRRAGIPVSDRPSGWERSPRTLAIQADLQAGVPDAEAARRHGVTPARVRDVRLRDSIPDPPWAWTVAERQVLILYQDQPARAVAALVGRAVLAVATERSRLIGQGLIRPKIVRPRPRTE